VPTKTLARGGKGLAAKTTTRNMPAVKLAAGKLSVGWASSPCYPAPFGGSRRTGLSSSVSSTLVDPTQAAFSSDALPVAPLTLANFASRTLSWETPAGVLQGVLTSLTLNSAPIPEPGTLPMLALALAATAWAARRRMR